MPVRTFEERLQRVPTEVWIDNYRISVEPVEDRSGICSRGVTDVTSLGVEQHRDVIWHGRDQLPQQRHSLVDVRLEEGDVRLVAACDIGGGLDDGVQEVAYGDAGRDAGAVRVEAHAEQGVIAAAGLNELRRKTAVRRHCVLLSRFDRHGSTVPRGVALEGRNVEDETRRSGGLKESRGETFDADRR